MRRLPPAPTEPPTSSALPQAVVTPDGRIAAANEALARLAAQPADELVGRRVLDLCDTPLDVAVAELVLGAAGRGERTGEVEIGMRDGTGRLRQVRAVWTADHDDLTVTVVDETDRWHEYEARARHEARTRTRFDRSGVPQAVASLDGGVVDVNDAWAVLVGRPREELLGRPLLPGCPDDGDAALGRLRAGTDNVQVEETLTRADGAVVPVRIDLTLLRDARGRPDGVAALLQDLTSLRDTERRSREQEEFFVALSQRANDAAFVADVQGRLLFVSPSVRHLFGIDPEQLLGVSGFAFVHPDDLDRVQGSWHELVESGGTQTFVVRLRAGDGTWRWVEETATNLLATPVAGVVCNLADVTQRVEAEAALRASAARFRAIVETAQEGICVVDRDGTTVYVNQRMADLVGVDVARLTSRPLTSLLDPAQAADVERRIRERLVRGSERYEVTARTPDGRDLVLLVAAAPLLDDDGRHEGSVAMVSDVTAARAAEQALRQNALHDALTGLPNRVLLLDRLEHALVRESVGTAVLFLDLDQFKLVNDSLGHVAGDELLVAVAQRMRASVRPGDTVARFGGDEFVIVCEDVDDDAALDLAEHLLARLDEPVEVAGGRLHVHASIGVAVSPPTSAGELLRYADMAMYAAKAGGRRRARLFDRGLSEQVEQRYAVARALHAAIGDGELEMRYQPVVELGTGRVLGVEALARWDSPTLGVVPPARFVPVAELTGLAAELDAFAVRAALTGAAELRAAGALPASAYVAVNLSARSVVDAALAQQVISLAEETGTDPSRVVLEITEGVLVDDPERASAVLRRLRDVGFAVAVDDFGTGYSSLAYLRTLPISALKIDRTFVAGIEDDADALAIAASVLDLARAVGLDVVAEGVETEAQAALLAELGCTAAQGWLWSRALPAAKAREAGWRQGFGALDTSPRPLPRRRRADAVPGPEHGRDRLLALHAQGASLATIAAALNSQGFRTPDGVRWHRNSVARAVTAIAYPQLGAPREQRG